MLTKEAEKRVEAAVVREHRLVHVAEVPFAEVHRVIALAAQQLGNRHLARRYALGCRRGGLARGVLVEDRLVFPCRREIGDGAREHGVGADHARRKPGGRVRIGGRKFIPKTRWIAPGHQRGATRCASGITGIAVGEGDAIMPQRVDIGRLDIRMSVTTKITPPPVISEDKENIRTIRAFALALICRDCDR